jgi:hypothetical protein
MNDELNDENEMTAREQIDVNNIKADINALEQEESKGGISTPKGGIHTSRGEE